MKNVRFYLAGCFLATLLSCTCANSQWLKVTTGLPSHWAAGIAMDARGTATATIVVDNKIYRTTTDGAMWDSVGGGLPAMCVSIVDSAHMWIGTIDGKILGTANGGKSWEQQFSDPSKTGFINYIRLFDLNFGVAMGDGLSSQGPAAFLRTTNGGITWISMNDSAFGGYTGDIWRQVCFLDADTGFFFSSYAAPPQIFKTTTGGAHWTLLPNSPNQGSAIKFYSSKIGMTLTSNGKANRTTDGGVSWETITIPQCGWGEAVEFAPGDPSKVWVTDKARVYVSNDTGRTWATQLTAPGCAIAFTSPTHGWVLDNTGGVFRTSNGGVTGVPEGVHPMLRQFSLEQNYPNPFNPTTTIRYSLPHKSNVQLSAFNTLGQHVATLVQGEQEAGYHEVQLSGSGLASGVYFCRIQAGTFVQTKKLVLLR